MLQHSNAPLSSLLQPIWSLHLHLTTYLVHAAKRSAVFYGSTNFLLKFAALEKIAQK